MFGQKLDSIISLTASIYRDYFLSNATLKSEIQTVAFSDTILTLTSIYTGSALWRSNHLVAISSDDRIRGHLYGAMIKVKILSEKIL